MIHSSFNNCLASCYKRCLYFSPWLFCCQLLLCTLDKAREDGKQSGSMFLFFFLKYVETAAGFLGLVCTRQEGAAENQVASNAVQPLQCVYGTWAGPEAVCVLSAIPKCYCTLLALSPSCPFGWTGTAAQPTQISVLLISLLMTIPHLVSQALDFSPSTILSSILPVYVQWFNVMNPVASGILVLGIISSPSWASLGK